MHILAQYPDPTAHSLTLSTVRFAPSQIDPAGTYVATARMGQNQYDISVSGTLGRRRARSVMKAEALAHFGLA